MTRNTSGQWRSVEPTKIRHSEKLIKASANTIAVSLEGTWREEHLFALEQDMQRCDFLEQQLEDCEARITAQFDSLTRPDDSAGSGTVEETLISAASPTTASKRSRGKSVASNEKAMSQALHEMMGVDLTTIPTIGVNTALVIASEIGPDFSAFPTVQHFCSWPGLAPGTRISGGKSVPGRAHKVVNPVAQALRIAAMMARSSQSFIGAPRAS